MSDPTELAIFGIRSFGFLLPVGPTLTGHELAKLISGHCDSPKAQAVATAISDTIASFERDRLLFTVEWLPGVKPHISGAIEFPQQFGPVAPTGAGSQRYGPCEVCDTHADSVYLRKVGRDYVFGHHDCLQALDKEAQS